MNESISWDVSYQISHAQASELLKLGTWREWEPFQRAVFQLQQEFMAMPWCVFHDAVKAATGRDVPASELSNAPQLLAEIQQRTRKDVFDGSPINSA